MTNLKRENYSSSKVIIRTPYELTRTLTVKPRDAGEQALGFFKKRFPYIPESEWQRRIDSGWIQTGGEALRADSCLRAHQIVTHYTPEVREPSVAGNVQPVAETENWIIVNKPAPLPMHQGGRYYKNTLSYILQEMGYEDLNPVHRLDAVTSGLVLFAKNREWALKIMKFFEDKRVDKWYHAVVQGEMRDEVRIDLPVRRKKGFVFECGSGMEDAKPARTHIIPEKILPDGKTLVCCVPETGRTHQIRLHLKAAGFPIFDDPIYGPEGDASGLKLQNSAISLRSSGIVISELGIKSSLSATEDL